jgi:hypothetical protein
MEYQNGVISDAQAASFLINKDFNELSNDLFSERANDPKMQKIMQQIHSAKKLTDSKQRGEQVRDVCRKLLKYVDNNRDTATMSDEQLA